MKSKKKQKETLFEGRFTVSDIIAAFTVLLSVIAYQNANHQFDINQKTTLDIFKKQVKEDSLSDLETENRFTQQLDLAERQFHNNDSLTRRQLELVNLQFSLHRKEVAIKSKEFSLIQEKEKLETFASICTMVSNLELLFGGKNWNRNLDSAFTATYADKEYRITETSKMRGRILELYKAFPLKVYKDVESKKIITKLVFYAKLMEDTESAAYIDSRGFITDSLELEKAKRFHFYSQNHSNAQLLMDLEIRVREMCDSLQALQLH